MSAPDDAEDVSATGADAAVDAPTRADIARLLLVAALLGILVGGGFEAFERAMERTRDAVWFDLAGEQPGAWTTIAIATVGGLALGVVLELVPGGGGQHPGDVHSIVPQGEIPLATALGIVVAGFVSLVAGASLGPEGAVIPAAAGIAAWVAATSRVDPRFAPLLRGAGLAALLAAMFGSPLAGVIPLLEVVPLTGVGMTTLVLPALTAASTATLTLRMLDVEPAGFLPLEYAGFERGHILWAVLFGILGGLGGLAVHHLTPLLRSATRRLDATNVLLTTTLAGAAIGGLYAIGGDDTRFSGIPELMDLIDRGATERIVIAAIAVKIVATSLSLAAGYRGGRIFPLTYIGGAIGLLGHVVLDGVPLSLAVGAGLAGSMAAGLAAPVTAALIAGVLLGPSMLPLAVLAVVASHTVHLLAGQMAAGPTPAPPTAP
ncbi:MAG: chloride channel protein [Actinobacteria bacterium]|nr:chloride channel protein [Actinomycetota bacterium]